jgi:hypothetical protein
MREGCAETVYAANMRVQHSPGRSVLRRFGTNLASRSAYVGKAMALARRGPARARRVAPESPAVGSKAAAAVKCGTPTISL